MIAYRYDDNSYYAYEQECQKDPVASERAGNDVWLLPGNCTYVKPPDTRDGYNIKWTGSDWEYEEVPATESEEEPYAETKEGKLASLDQQYSTDRSILKSYYLDFVLDDDTDGMNEIKEELADLAEQYQVERKAIEEEEE